MTWWFHLLVRRVETYTERREVFGRVTCSVGRFSYVEKALPLLFISQMIMRPTEWDATCAVSKRTIGLSVYVGSTGKRIYQRLYPLLSYYRTGGGPTVERRGERMWKAGTDLDRAGGEPAAELDGVYRSWWIEGVHQRTEITGSLEAFAQTMMGKRVEEVLEDWGERDDY